MSKSVLKSNYSKAIQYYKEQDKKYKRTISSIGKEKIYKKNKFLDLNKDITFDTIYL